MIPEFGHLCLILALLTALLLGVVPLVGAQTGQVNWMNVARTLARWQFILVTLSFVSLAIAFAQNDFTVRYVATNSNSQLPLHFRLSAVWGAHEGSLLLWAFILSGWTIAVAQFSKQLPIATVARVLAVMGLIAVGFLSFLLFTSNPFLRTLPDFPIDGRDLNPLLQDFGLIVHPPMLYMGYVGFSVAFAFAIAALIGGEMDSAWAKWSRPWTTVAWMFLTLGITLGSWWAYYELGWGGWWFWDPVENASFIPWLVGTALMHSLAVTEKRGGFKAWTTLLAICAFSMSLLGTFLVRSGVLTSVHAFASDPVRGTYILVFLVLVIGSSLLLFALRGSQIKTFAQYEWCSREMALLSNNVLLTITAAMVLLGTLQPLIVDALNLGKISVGPPYFNFMFSVFMLPLIFLAGIGPQIKWRHDDAKVLLRRLMLLFALVLIAALMITFAFALMQPSILVAIVLAFWIVTGLLVDIWSRIRQQRDKFAGLQRQTRAFWGMISAHLGIAVAVIGVCLSMALSVERDLRLAPGQTAEIGPYQFQFVRTREHEGANFTATRGYFDIKQNGVTLARLQPEKRIYNASRQAMTEAAIDPGLTRDLYVAMGEPLGNDAWAVRVYYKPFVRWIWLGGVLMTFGGLLSVSDRRYRRATASETVNEGVSA